MVRYIILTIFVLATQYGLALEPEYSLKTKGAVTSIFIEDNKLYAATDAGSIDIFDWKKRSHLKSITFPTIKDFMGDDMPPKIYSIDKWPGQDRMIVVTQGSHGFRNIYLIKDGNKVKLLDADKDKMMIKKALLVNEEKILLATLGNEIMLYDLNKKTFIYQKQISSSVFSDVELNDDKSLLASTDESGIIHIINVATGEITKDLSGMNLDNIYQLVYNNQTIIGAGQDRKASVYSTNSNKKYYLESTFIVYCVGLSNDGEWGAFSYGEDNDVKVFNTITKTEMTILKGQKSTLTQIKFVEDDYIITSSEDRDILIWKWR
ncbi:MAG: hypothetical protein GQ527_11195 [Bacteroidales bacterium]|nr:hypothetical protein [Bacteroidales bacterium]